MGLSLDLPVDWRKYGSNFFNPVFSMCNLYTCECRKINQLNYSLTSTAQTETHFRTINNTWHSRKWNILTLNNSQIGRWLRTSAQWIECTRRKIMIFDFSGTRQWCPNHQQEWHNHQRISKSNERIQLILVNEYSQNENWTQLIDQSSFIQTHHFCKLFYFSFHTILCLHQNSFHLHSIDAENLLFFLSKKRFSAQLSLKKKNASEAK